ncbi:MAG: DUF2007 domain-containing protein [Phycisphaerae bacterium]|nr:DUF2007 domain-containing protein [Phycisphaerae bacterium]
MRDNERLVTVGEFENEMDAKLAKLALEQEGIACSLAGGDLISVIPYLNVIHVELQVFERDAERAVEILNEMTPLDEGDEDFDEEFDEDDDDEDFDELDEEEDVG